MNSDFVDFSEFQASNLMVSPFQQKQSKAEAGQKPITYNEMPISYNYGTAEQPIIREFYLQYPEMSTISGLVEGQTGGRKAYSVPVSVQLTNPDHTKLIDVLKGIHTKCADEVKPVRVKVGMPHFDPKLSEATGFAFPLYYPKDKETGEVINGKNPSCFLKMKYAEYGKRVDKTLFTDMKGSQIDWKLLDNVEMKFIPLVHVEKLYIGGGKVRIQMKCVSAIVTSIVKRGTVSLQQRTIQRFQPKDTEALERQLNALREMSELTVSNPVSSSVPQGSPEVKNLNDFLNEM